MTMIDKFIAMLGEMSKAKTDKSIFKAAIHWFKAWKLKREIIRYYNHKDGLDANDVYNCIFMINHAVDHTIDFLHSAFDTHISNVGASFHYQGQEEEDLLISIHKAVNEKKYSSIDIDATMLSKSIHHSVNVLSHQGYYATTLIVVLEIVLQRIFSGDL